MRPKTSELCPPLSVESEARKISEMTVVKSKLGHQESSLVPEPSRSDDKKRPKLTVTVKSSTPKEHHGASGLDKKRDKPVKLAGSMERQPTQSKAGIEHSQSAKKPVQRGMNTLPQDEQSKSKKTVVQQQIEKSCDNSTAGRTFVSGTWPATGTDWNQFWPPFWMPPPPWWGQPTPMSG